MERVNTRRMNALSSPESDEVAPFGRFSAGQRHGEEAPELLTGYLVRIGRGTLLTPERGQEFVASARCCADLSLRAR